MAASILIARIIGPSLLVVAAGIMVNRECYRKVMEDYCKNAALIFFGGMIALVIGIVIVLVHNIWVADWRVLITVYGWGGLIKGTWLIVFPGTVAGFMEAYRKNKSLLAVHAALAALLGLCLTFFGYFAP